MSVIKSKRTTSDLEFLATARNIQIHTIKKCVNFPKRYTFYISQNLVSSATKIYEFVKKGNSVYPTNQHEVQMRRDYFLNAYTELQSLISQIEVAKEFFPIDENAMMYWMELISSEIKLIKAVLRADKERYKFIG